MRAGKFDLIYDYPKLEDQPQPDGEFKKGFLGMMKNVGDSAALRVLEEDDAMVWHLTASHWKPRVPSLGDPELVGKLERVILED